MKTVAMIPIKLNNERFPGKNIKRFFDGTPLISFIQKTLLKTEGINKIYVYCSDKSIQEYLLPGVEFLKRPLYLDGQSCNCNDILAEFMKAVEADIYVASHATGPFTRSESVSKCIEAVKSGQYDSAFIAAKVQQFLWKDGVPLNFDIQNFPRTQDLDPIYIETPGAYVFKKNVFLKYHRRVGIKPYICESEEYEEIDIDNKKDFDLANIIYQKITELGEEL